jgi:divalent metal cation (Fe/Co/Zn/Cd) transporter
MNFLRVILGLAIAAIGFVAGLVILVAGIFYFFQANDSPVERFGSALIFALLAGAIMVGTFYAFRNVVDRTPLDEDGE